MEQDKGVNGRLYIFNPDCELAIANGSRFYMPPVNIVKMAEDLAFLPAWLGREGDGVLVREKPGKEFYRSVCEQLGVKCRPLLEEELKAGGRWKGEPWGQSPKMNHWLATRGMGEEWSEVQKEWYSRKTAREGLKKMQEACPWVEREILPQIACTLEDIASFVQGRTAIAKAPWSSSGKGLLTLENRLAGKEKEWLGGILRRQGYVMLEPKLDKVYDFAMEFRAGETELFFIGWSAFTVGEQGGYRGNYTGPQEDIRQNLLRWVREEILEELKLRMPGWLKELLPDYRGYLGVDMMIYRNAAGEYLIQPCVEINLRYNMGIVALCLSERYLAEGTRGQFEISYYSGEGEALQVCLREKRNHPPVYKNNRIRSGYLCLTPVGETTRFVASLRCY